MDYLLNDDESDNNLARKIFIFSNPECGVGINIQLSLQGFYNEIQKTAEEKMNTITLQDIIDIYYQRISIENNLQNII